MAGLFGGYLGLVNIIGMGILFVLIGSKAFKPDARTARLVFGSLISGSVLGAALAPLIVRGEAEVLAYILLGFVGFLLLGTLTAILEAIHRAIKD